MPLVAAAAITAGGALLSSRSASNAASKSAQASQNATDMATAEQRRQYDLSRADNAPWLQAGQGALSQLSQLYGLNRQAPAGAVTQPMPATPAGYGSMMGGVGASAGTQARLAAQGAPTNSPIFRQMMDMIDAGQLEGDPAPGMMATGQPGQPQTTATASAPAQGGGQFDNFWQSPDYLITRDEGLRGLTARNSALGIQDSGAAQKSAMRFASGLGAQQFGNFANRLSALAGVGQTAAGQNQQLGQNYAGAVGNLAMNNANNLATSYQQQGQAQQALWGNLASIGSGLFANGGFRR